MISVGLNIRALFSKKQHHNLCIHLTGGQGMPRESPYSISMFRFAQLVLVGPHHFGESLTFASFTDCDSHCSGEGDMNLMVTKRLMKATMKLTSNTHDESYELGLQAVTCIDLLNIKDLLLFSVLFLVCMLF